MLGIYLNAVLSLCAEIRVSTVVLLVCICFTFGLEVATLLFAVSGGRGRVSQNFPGGTKVDTGPPNLIGSPNPYQAPCH